MQLQPVPLSPVAVNPLGSVSTTVTSPLVGPVPLLRTVTVYGAPVCPCVHVPACVFVTVESATGAAVITVSVAVAVTKPVPHTPLSWPSR